jgi:hypothetical protein
MYSGKQGKKPGKQHKAPQVLVDSNISAHDDDDTKPWYDIPTLDFSVIVGRRWKRLAAGRTGQLGAASPDQSPESAQAPRLRLQGAIPY